jgi:hypothetical protein
MMPGDNSPKGEVHVYVALHLCPTLIALLLRKQVRRSRDLDQCRPDFILGSSAKCDSCLRSYRHQTRLGPPEHQNRM